MLELLKKKTKLYDSLAESREKALEKWDRTKPLWRAGRIFDVLMAINASQYVEIGCGAGLLAETFWRPKILGWDPRYLAGVDISMGMLLLTKGNILPPSGVIRAAAESLPFADQSIECIVCDCTIQVCAVPKQAMDELKRVAKTWLVVSWFHRDRIRQMMELSLRDGSFHVTEAHSYALKGSPTINYQIYVAQREEL